MWAILLARSPGDNDGVGVANTELGKSLAQSLFWNRNERRHSAGQTQYFEEAGAAVETRGEGDGIQVDHDGDAGPFLPEEKEQRFVVLSMILRRVDEGERPDGLGHPLGRHEIDEDVAGRNATSNLLDRAQLRRGFVDRRPKRGIVQSPREMADHDAKQRRVARTGPEGAVQPQAERPGLPGARVDGARVVVRTRIRFGSAAKPLGCAAQAVEVRVAYDGADGAEALDHLGSDHFGAGPVFRFGREDEAWIATIAPVQEVIVMVHPRGKARSELLDEGKCYFFEAAARRFGRECYVENDYSPLEVPRGRELPRRGKCERGIGQDRGEGCSMYGSLRPLCPCFR